MDADAQPHASCDFRGVAGDRRGRRQHRRSAAASPRGRDCRIGRRRRADARRLDKAGRAAARGRARRVSHRNNCRRSSPTSSRTSVVTTISSTCCSRWSRRCSSTTPRRGGCRRKYARSVSTAATILPLKSAAIASCMSGARGVDDHHQPSRVCARGDGWIAGRPRAATSSAARARCTNRHRRGRCFALFVLIVGSIGSFRAESTRHANQGDGRARGRSPG